MYGFDPVEAAVGVFLALVGVAVVVLVAAALYVSFDNDSDQHHRLSHARQQAAHICGGSTSSSYDAQDQTVLVYACSDGRLRTIDYGSKY